MLIGLSRRIAAAPARLWPERLIQRELLTRADGRFPALDGVRAIAALLIVFFHSAVCVQQTGSMAASTLPVGVVRWILDRCWIGVDVFFVLSGFLIGRILLVQLRAEGIDFRGFYRRRLYRIFPAYYVVLSLSLFVFARSDTFRLLYANTPWPDLLRRSPANYLYLSNYLFSNAGNIMGWGWSLCIEEHFYLLFPLLLALLFRWTTSRTRVAVLLLLPLAPVAARAAVFLRDPSVTLWQRLNWESHTHCDPLLLGVLIAYLFVYHHAAFERVTVRLGPLSWVAGLFCIGVVFVWGGTIRPGFFAVVPQFLVLACGAGLLLINGLFIDNWVSRCLAHHFWYPIARVSYGMYLIHLFVVLWLLSLWPSLQVTLAQSGAALLGFGTVAPAATFAGASVLFLTVELPLLQRGARIRRRRGPAESQRAPGTAAVNGRAA